MNLEKNEIKMKKITKKQHKERHIELHKALDELFADYIKYHPEQIKFTDMPLIKLMNWSFEQTKNPDEIQQETELKK